MISLVCSLPRRSLSLPLAIALLLLAIAVAGLLPQHDAPERDGGGEGTFQLAGGELFGPQVLILAQCLLPNALGRDVGHGRGGLPERAGLGSLQVEVADPMVGHALPLLEAEEHPGA